MEHLISWKEIINRVENLYKIYPKNKKVYGVPRGGQYLCPFWLPVDTVKEADFIIDDLIESGATKNRYIKEYPNKPFVSLFDKRIELSDKWLVFPWEIKKEPLEDNILRICQHKGWKEFKTLEELKTKLNEN